MVIGAQSSQLFVRLQWFALRGEGRLRACGCSALERGLGETRVGTGFVEAVPAEPSSDNATEMAAVPGEVPVGARIVIQEERRNDHAQMDNDSRLVRNVGLHRVGRSGLAVGPRVDGQPARAPRSANHRVGVCAGG